MLKRLLLLFAAVMPMAVKKVIYGFCFEIDLEPGARIGFAYIDVDKLIMRSASSVGSGTVVRNLELLQLGEHSSLGNLNWITGFRRITGGKHFIDNPGRRSVLSLARHASVTHRHYIDCTDSVDFGEFATFAGIRSQLLTHSIDIERGRQACRAVAFGAYTFIGSGCIILPGSRLPDHCVLAAGSVLATQVTDRFAVYGGVPARLIKKLSEDSRYFTRSQGFVE